MDDTIAFCGVTCSNCPAYRATQAGDRDRLEEVLIHWREEFDVPHITVEDIMCDGCRAGGRLCGYCQHCAIRPCATTRGVPTCAHCDEYACEELERLLGLCDEQEGFFEFVRRARATLESIRSPDAGGLSDQRVIHDQHLRGGLV
jgi:hypothetical protein